MKINRIQTCRRKVKEVMYFNFLSLNYQKKKRKKKKNVRKKRKRKDHLKKIIKAEDFSNLTC